ncbi:MAG: hypothetical protein IKR18_06500 [Bacteroidaceae bacterium]|nr:hypothetical protein [Bacteroidaceae bacterium]
MNTTDFPNKIRKPSKQNRKSSNENAKPSNGTFKCSDDKKASAERCDECSPKQSGMFLPLFIFF